MSLLRYQEGGSLGSFESNGASFHYDYNAEKNSLVITRKDCGCDAFKIQLPEKIKTNPRLFIHQLEKATQIKALMLSNNQTIKLCETIVPEKLTTIAKNVSRLALNSFDIGNNRISKFSDILRRGFGLKTLEISYISHSTSSQSYYKAKLISEKDNCIVIREDTIAETLKKLSEEIASDLIIRELSAHSELNSQKLLKLSTRLSVISKILNQGFVPSNFVQNIVDSRHISKTQI